MGTKAMITLRAFEARCKRHAESTEGEVLKKCRPDSKWYADMGDYYFVALGSNGVTHRGWDIHRLIRWAREEGVLKPYEEVAL